MNVPAKHTLLHELHCSDGQWCSKNVHNQKKNNKKKTSQKKQKKTFKNVEPKIWGVPTGLIEQSDQSLIWSLSERLEVTTIWLRVDEQLEGYSVERE